MPSIADGSRFAAGGGSRRASRSEGFGKDLRLRKRRELLAVQQRGQARRTRHFVVLSKARHDTGCPRLGVTVSRKVGNAVARNRIKRRVRELFRRNRDRFLPHNDYVFIARNGAHVLTQAEVERELLAAIR